MERRRFTRKKAPRNRVYVYYKSERIHQTSAHDISSSGVFFKGASLPVPLGAKVQLIFVISHGSLIKTHRKSAIMTRVDHRGAAFGFLGSRHRTSNAALKAE